MHKTIIMEKKLKELLQDEFKESVNTIVLLQKIQNFHGYLPEDILQEASSMFNIPLADMYSVATFYAQFKFTKPGDKQVKVCHGTACHINGAKNLSDELEDHLKIKSGETTDDGKYSLENVACLGCCSLAPVIMVDETVHGNLDEKKVIKAIKE